jgi:hypothetical protein
LSRYGDFIRDSLSAWAYTDGLGMSEDTTGNRSHSGDELDRKLAELTSEIAKEARFKEKSAAERAADAAKARKAAGRDDRRAGRG